jgi:hypothetical protein
VLSEIECFGISSGIEGYEGLIGRSKAVALVSEPLTDSLNAKGPRPNILTAQSYRIIPFSRSTVYFKMYEL